MNTSKIAGIFLIAASVFWSSSDNQASAAEKEVFKTSNDVTVLDNDSVCIAFPYILKTGDVPWKPNDKAEAQKIDWQAEDAFTKALDTLRKDIFAIIENDRDDAGSPAALLYQCDWTKDHRVAWERYIGELVSAEVDKVKGLDAFRDINFSTSLNSLATDIEGQSYNKRFSCMEMSFVEGCLLQQIDDNFLQNGCDDYKKPTRYFYISGNRFSRYADGYELHGYHAFIVSAATGNVFEATAEPDLEGRAKQAYRQAVNDDHKIEDLMAGKPVVVEGESVYGSEMPLYAAKTALRVSQGGPVYILPPPPPPPPAVRPKPRGHMFIPF